MEVGREINKTEGTLMMPARYFEDKSLSVVAFLIRFLVKSSQQSGKSVGRERAREGEGLLALKCRSERTPLQTAP